MEFFWRQKEVERIPFSDSTSKGKAHALYPLSSPWEREKKGQPTLGEREKRITDGGMMLLPQFSSIKVFQEYNTKFRLN